MSLMRLPLSAWAWFITSCMGLTACSVLMPACILVILDHVAGTSFFVPSGLVLNDQLVPHSGGSTLLWQHLFWFFGHPEVYIAIVPGIGIVSHILIANMRKQMLSQTVLIYCMGALAVLSYMVYGHHMFVSGMNPISSLAFSFPTLVITIPATITVLIWVFSLYGSRLRINSASLFALGFVSMFVSGGVSGFFLAQPSIDIMLHATYFLVEFRRDVLHLHAVSLPGTGREHPPLFNICGRLPAAVDPGASLDHRCRSHHRGCPACFCLQPDSQPVLGQAGAG